MAALAKMDGDDVTGSIGPAAQARPAVPTETDLAFARNAASDVLTKGDKDASQPWENPETGARGSVTPLAQAYSSEGRTCRDFLASYVNGTFGKLAAGGGLPDRPRAVGNPYAEAVAAELKPVEVRRAAESAFTMRLCPQTVEAAHDPLVPSARPIEAVRPVAKMPRSPQMKIGAGFSPVV